MHDDLHIAQQFGLMPATSAGPNAGTKPPAKFRNNDNPAETWAGRGKRPNCLKAKLSAGHCLEDFRIQD